ncbi:MAG TPA: SAM-dependent methyltransferase [Actinomycetales bacterium]|nr:SAM-dependent methyltransferase [Actinomycetales bacterium]
MPILDLPDALAQVRSLILDDATFVSAIGAGRRRSAQAPLRRVEIRPVEIRGAKHGQVVRHGTEMRTDNYGSDAGARAAFSAAIDELLALPFGNWHVETTDVTYQLRVTKKGKAQVHRGPGVQALTDTSHDRAKQHLLAPDDPIFSILGADADKRRQVDAFLRNVRAAMRPAVERARAERRPLRVVDLGCGNAYLTFGVHRWLSQELPDIGVETVGVELREELVERSTSRARDAGLDNLRFMAGTIATGTPFGEASPDMVLALHACDTATDEALARAIDWQAPVVLAAPCCHRDIHRQLTQSNAPTPYGALTRHPIMRQRFADVLTDTLRSLLLQERGYRVEVVEFVDSRHTPRNALIRATYTGHPNPAAGKELKDLTTQWQVHPALEDLLAKPAP